MLKTLNPSPSSLTPNQTRVIAQNLVSAYRTQVENTTEDAFEKYFAAILPKPHRNEFMSERLIVLLRRQNKEKAQKLEELKNELSAAEHIIQAETHLRQKLELENAKLKKEKEALEILQHEENTMLTLALTKYRDEKDRYCTQLQEANKEITALEFELRDKKSQLKTVSQELVRSKTRITQEMLLRTHRDALIEALEKEKTFLLNAREEEKEALSHIQKNHARERNALTEINARLRQSIHFLDIENRYKDKELTALKDEKSMIDHARKEETEALLFFMNKYRTLQKEQSERVLAMKRDAYQEGLSLGSFLQQI